ncbi:LuxR C-terminal-related transcriptional regulator [Herbiconiux sp. SYSU D00978]|uniref:LuxR C-terminal-related transcriptional regulator n=1 Tax=Herbiconiux sp. SYSU D00978 TaxID=2812562 RepID=UPI001A9765E0|nr:LuxR C-terminal-related transcriptional regulator [Herbiconiux sp. SYSU D00978]
MSITAPPGFGKTSILAEWLADPASPACVAWVSLDDRDNSARTFWRYALTALAGATRSAEQALAVLEAAEAPIDAALTALVNELDLSADEVVLVLDDFHAIEDRDILHGVEFLVENAPPNLRIVLAGRADPALPLGRLRASGRLVELRAADLRFTEHEVADYLRATVGDVLAPAESAALAQRTEGWIAAIQLAAISLEGRTDASDFVQNFAGDDRHVVDYLMEEVLRRQPAALRTFLLDTSVLGRFTSDLVEAVTGAPAGAAALESLERANLFLVPLDDRRGWYRYHHLFAQMLRARLLVETPQRVGMLHERASEWFEKSGLAEDAILHAVAAGRFDRAAALISAEAPTLRRRRDESTLVRWLELLPRPTVRASATLSLGLAGALLSVGRVDEVDELLESAATGAPTDELRAVEGGVALYRAACALAGGDVKGAAEQAQLAADLAADGDHLARGSALGLIGLTRWSRGNLSDAETSWSVAVEQLRLADHVSDSLGGTIALTDIAMAQGRLGHAAALARDALSIAQASDPPLKGASDMLVALATVLLERDDLEGARRCLAEADDLGDDNGLPQNRHRLLTLTARLHLSEGDADAAIAAFDAAERAYTPDFFPDHRPIAAQRARAYLAAERHQDARDWLRRRGLAIDDELTYLTEYEHLTLARILLADGAEPTTAARVTELLERMLDSAEQGGRRGSAIEVRALLSLSHARQGRLNQALETLQSAVRSAEPEGHVRPFADEGERMARMLTLLARSTPRDLHLRRLIDATNTTPAPDRSARSVPLGPPLSEREFDVLRLLRSDLGGAAIARELSVSLNTLRTHTKSIYTKLGVTSRREAVTRATQLQLL